MKIVCYTFNYRKTDVVKNLNNNSVTYNNAIMKFPTNMLDPVIRIDLGEGNTTFPTYNYVYIEELGQRYYFVQNIVAFTDRIFDLYLHVDVLYTYVGKATSAEKTGKQMFIERCEYDWDKTIIDDRLPLKSFQQVEYNAVPNTSETKIDLMNITSSTRNVIVSVILRDDLVGLIPDGSDIPSSAFFPNFTDMKAVKSSATSHNMGTIYYLLTAEQARWVGIACLYSDTIRSYIKSYTVYPFDVTQMSPSNYEVFNTNGMMAFGDPSNPSLNITLPTSVTDRNIYALKYGALNFNMLNCSCQSLVENALTHTTNIGFSNSWILNEPYSKYELYIPYVGYVPIERDLFYNPKTETYTSGNFVINLTINPDTAESCVDLFINGRPYKSVKCKIGTEVSLSSTNAYENQRKTEAINLQETGTAIIGTLSAITGAILSATGVGAGLGVGMIGGGISSIIGGTMNGEAQLKQVITYGSGGTSSKVDGLFSLQTFMIRATYVDSVINPTWAAYSGEYGHPYKANKNLGALRGYVECGKVEWALGNTQEEKELEELMVSGVHFPTYTW